MIKEFIINYALELLCSSLIGSMVLMLKRVNKIYKSMREYDEDSKRVDKILLKNDLWKFTTACLERGYTYPDEMSLLDDSYREYKALGGNGVIEARYKKAISLPDISEYKTRKKGDN